MVTIEQMLKEAIARDASDIFLVAGIHMPLESMEKFTPCRKPG